MYVVIVIWVLDFYLFTIDWMTYNFWIFSAYEHAIAVVVYSSSSLISTTLTQCVNLSHNCKKHIHYPKVTNYIANFWFKQVV